MRPECRSYCCHFSHRSCLTSCFTFYSFFTTLVATRRCRCLLRSARVNVMPERLLSVISGILAGGSSLAGSSVLCFFCWCFYLRFCGCLLFGLCVPPLVFWGFLVCCWRLPSPADCCLPPPSVVPLWRPGPVTVLVPPSGYLVPSCDGPVALP